MWNSVFAPGISETAEARTVPRLAWGGFRAGPIPVSLAGFTAAVAKLESIK
jgi:hypothetical protein